MTTRRFGFTIALTVSLACLQVWAQAPSSTALSPHDLRSSRILRAREIAVAQEPSGSSKFAFGAVPLLDSGTKLGPSDPGGRDFFGSNVAVEGDVAVVGANETDGHGAAYVFERKNGTWTQRAKLVAADRVGDAQFGENVKIVGNTIAVGAPNDRNGTGAVYSFQKTGDVWTQQAKLTASDATEQAFFADIIALGQDMLVSGADLSVVPGVGTAGAVYVFRRSGTVWTQDAKLIDPNPTLGGAFGSGTANVDRDTLAIGASGDQASGILYLFTRSRGVWAVQSQLLPSSPEAGQSFGLNIDTDGNSILIFYNATS